MTTVTVRTAPLTLAELLAVVDGADVALDEPVRARMAAARAVVDRALADDVAVYGLTTQVGHGKDTRLTPEQVREQQLFLIMSHAGGLGAPLGVRRVRAALAVRVNGLARGGSGASPAAAEVLVAMLNRGVHPVLPARSSVGAADLGQLAYVAQVAVGRGQADYAGQVLPGGEALRRAGIEPLVPGGKDGLALISANAVSIGHGALVADRARRVADLADLAAAVSMEATGANPSIVHPAVAAAKGIAAQQAAADHLRALLAGSARLEPDAEHSVQDALSFRVVPQVHGAFRHLVTAFTDAVAQELNAAADNPLVSVADQVLISNGNFHPMVMALAADALRVAVTHVGLLSEHRLSHLWEACFARLGAYPPPVAPVGIALRYTAAAVYAELRQLAGPATLDVPALDLGVEDHGTGAPLTVELTDRSLDLLEDLLVVEVLLARDLRDLTPEPRPRLGRGTDLALRAVEAAVGGAEPRPDAVHRAVKDGLAQSSSSAAASSS